MMRRAAILILLFFVSLAAVAAQVAGDELHVVGRLVSVQAAQPHCGILFVGTTATYLVLDGPASLKGKEIYVVVPCIEMPRAMYNPEAGDLDTFTPGRTHHLAITKKAIHRLDEPDKLPDGADWFYLRAASLKPLSAPNAASPVASGGRKR